MADVLSRPRSDVSDIEEVKELSETFASLILCIFTMESESVGLDALNLAYLLWRIRQTQRKEEA